MDLEPGETATVVLVYTVPLDRQLGETDGSLLITSNDTSSTLTFTFYITSDDRHDIQVLVEDEYTYFAADKPLLAEAVVTLTQPRRMFSKTFITNETGILNFDGIHADRYTLQVEAANHTSKSVIIVVDGSTSTYRVFLQRTAVTYTWSVTKTTFEDNCLDALSRNCGGSGRRRREVNSELVLEVNFVDVSVDIFGNLSVVDIKGEWKQAFFKGVSENSPSQYLLDSSEVDIILLLVLEDDQAILNTFLQRWNNTFSSWIDGRSGPPQSNVMSLKDVRTLGDTFIENTRTVKERGFSSVFHYFGYSMTECQNSVQGAKPEGGICAKVRKRITQNLVLTRDAFQARLEIENGEEGSLEKIDVDIFITRTGGNGALENNLFSIGQPKLEGISDVSGTGTLATGVKGSADWFIVAYTGAAVDEDVNYDVGGTLSYFVDDKEFNVPLLPDTITPNPSLTLAYFHEKYVQGDDPMTTQVEPVVPFPLAVMVTNKGNGIARQVKISSGQPEIIENEKGLLVSFKITRAQLGMESIQPSLTVDFGDIVSHETKTARWWMTSTLKGRFYNYSATFENINPLGDPQLSVFDSISYHDMIHQVRIDSIGADGLDDFLVNDVVDKDNLPDRLYDSSNGFYSYPVDSVSAIGFSKTKEEFGGRKKYMYVEILVQQVNESWVYVRVINNTTRDLSSESLPKVTKDVGKNILIPQNSWLTSYYKNKFYFHLFDNYTRIVQSPSNR
ncbi:uncharacterized protein LOC125384389 [Haliotis rufescens]|uniref:uncharacterized protein LOC125384389 n=1 Tax=Haliotis rufescens TaxID=6454 RepID=UPI00201ED51D|nr:uncharacterized protein LOC125384389 [Haliotis rufescens]